MGFYVQRQDSKEGVPLKTIDEAMTRHSAAILASIYRDGDPSAIYYVSTCKTKGWVNK